MSHFFTWCNNSKGKRRIECKLDRVLVNDNWGGIFLRSLVVSNLRGLLDHSPHIVECKRRMQLNYSIFG